MSQKNNSTNGDCPIKPSCPVDSTTQVPLNHEPILPDIVIQQSAFEFPIILAEPKIQVVVEADIPLDPPAFEIKRVGKDIFLTQCKLVPVEFVEERGIRFVTRAKLFVEGFIRKNIEYATEKCNEFIHDKIADVPFFGFSDLKFPDDFLNPAILNGSSESSSRFINPKDGITPRQDKYFFENSVVYNEQPFCKLVSAKFFELDFSPCPVDADKTFDRLREKIVVDLTLRVLQ
ncbi:CsxC family protein, partial [Jeotgalibacillus marinus]